MSLLLLSIALQSCVTRETVGFKVLSPAEITVPADVYQICIVNQAIAPRTDSNGVFYAFAGKLYYDTIKYDTLLSWSAIDGVLQTLAESGRFQLSSDPLLLPRKKGGPTNLPLGFNVLDSLFDSLSTHCALVLEDVRAFDLFDYFGFEQGLYYMKMKVIGEAYFTFYDIKHQQVIDRFSVSDTLFFDNVAYGWERCIEAFPDRATAFSQIARQLGRKYASRLSPVLRNEQRFYFSGSQADLQKGAEYARQGLWVTAARYWKNPATGRKKTLAARAAFNMALASEMEGKIDVALYWIEQSLLRRQMPEAQNYRNILVHRKAEVDRLVEQMKIEP
ncbi:MAG: DUF6340 family protein [Bacteroidales bacterium]